ncbi:MAG TPA: PepSY domain-containing protein [Povalibacter sp.]|uniref:PepSY domain-containing protein n=1 Tax=Povalibacter sp. TaxID=1962978 RepID=UPI002CDF88C6|nr:PepSY domain-containing protein [Povalibacter sp.]HMN45253.1 PepSY domain-containing protein [Povalibacter sp.]
MNIKHTLWRWLVVGHRWLGIVTCVLFALWFASGLVMMYVGYPQLTSQERLARLEPIDWSRVKVEPQAVLDGLSLPQYPRSFRLVMVNGEPVYQIAGIGWPVQAVSAADGRAIENIEPSDALSIARRSAPDAAPTKALTIERDQWSVAGTFDPHRPLHLVALNDADGTEWYVSSRTGEIVLDSTRGERGWNWVGAVLHWLYFRDLRANGPLWSQVVMWTSGVGIVVAITGLWLGIDRLRLRRRNRAVSITPFRGWMAWHHVAGIVGGVFLLTWIFSGWLSMGPPVPWERPFDPLRMQAGVSAYSGNTEARFPVAPNVLQSLGRHRGVEATFDWALGQPRIELKDAAARAAFIDASSGSETPLDESALVAAAPTLIADAKLVASLRLEREDAYWYSRRSKRTLPVLRFVFDDPDQTWVHVDPRSGKVIGWMRRSDRIHRWLFNALHSFDFRWLLASRPSWDALLWMLSIAGVVISVSGVTLGWRHLTRR